MNKFKKISLSILAISATSLAAYQYKPNQLVQQNMLAESNKIDDIQIDEGELLDSSSGEVKTAQGTLSYGETLDNSEISLNNKLIYSLNCDDEDSEEIKENRVQFSCFHNGYEVYQVRKIQDDIVFLFKDEENESLMIVYFNDQEGLKETKNIETKEPVNGHLFWGNIIKYGKNLINESNGIKSIYVKNDKLFIELNNDKDNDFKYQYYYSKGIIYPDFDTELVARKIQENSKILKNNVELDREEKSIDLAAGKLTIFQDDMNVLVYLNQKLVDKFELQGSVDVRFFKQKDESFFLLRQENFGTAGVGGYEIIEYSPQAIRKKTASISQDTGSSDGGGAKITLLADGLHFDWGILPDGVHYIDDYKNGKVMHKKIVDSEKQEEAILEKCTQQHGFIVDIYKERYSGSQIDWTDIYSWPTAANGYDPKIIWKDKKLYNEYIKTMRDAMNGNLVDCNEFRAKFCQGNMQ